MTAPVPTPSVRSRAHSRLAPRFPSVRTRSHVAFQHVRAPGPGLERALRRSSSSRTPPPATSRAASRCSTAASTSSSPPRTRRSRSRISGRLRHEGEFPAVGDWVAYADGLIHAVLPRRTAFVRRAAGNETVAQVLAANVDTVFLVMAFYRDLNPRRLERYLALAWESGADPVSC